MILHDLVLRVSMGGRYFDNYLQNLKQKAQLEDKFDKLGIDINKDYPKIISKINTRRLANNPVDLDSSQIKKIILN